MPWVCHHFPFSLTEFCFFGLGFCCWFGFFNSSLNDSEMDLSTVPVKWQLPLVWHPSVNAIKTNICSQKLLPDLCCFFQCLPGFSSPSPVIPTDPQKSKDPYSCDIAATSAGLLKLRSYNWKSNAILFTRKRKFASCEGCCIC